MFIKEQQLQIGDKCKTTKELSCMKGTMTIGSIVTIIEIDTIRGYGIIDDDGNKIIECGWDCLEKI